MINVFTMTQRVLEMRCISSVFGGVFLMGLQRETKMVDSPKIYATLKCECFVSVGFLSNCSFALTDILHTNHPSADIMPTVNVDKEELYKALGREYSM